MPAEDAALSGAWGSGAWGGFTPTALIVEHIDEDGTAKVVCARGASEHPQIAAHWHRLRVLSSSSVCLSRQPFMPAPRHRRDDILRLDVSWSVDDLCGVALIASSLMTAILMCVERNRSGIASGVLNTFREAGSAFDVAPFRMLMVDGTVSGIQDSIILSGFCSCWPWE